MIDPKLKFKSVGKTHFLARGSSRHIGPFECECSECSDTVASPKIHTEGQDFWNTYYFSPCSKAVGVWRGKEVVGFFRYEVEDQKDPYGRFRTLYACGTWVLSTLRGQGIGSRLWHHALSRWSPDVVEVTAATMEGDRLVECVRARYPHIDFSKASAFEDLDTHCTKAVG